jgi:HTH-type transcriptional regulator, quorum sensing regulator NprR
MDEQTTSTNASTTTTATSIRESMMRDTPAIRLGQRIRRARLSRNITQGAVARGIFSLSYVSAVERGQIRPSLGALEKLAERLQVSVTDLLGTSDLVLPAASSHEARAATSERQRDDVESRLREAQHLASTGSAAESKQAVDMLLRLGSQPLAARDAVHLYERLATLYILLGRSEDARRAAQDGLSQAERLGDTVLADRLRVQLGDAYRLLGSDRLAIEQYTRAARTADQGPPVQAGHVGDPVVLLHALEGLGTVYERQGQPEEAGQVLRQATELARDLTNPERLAAVYWTLSEARSRASDTAEARAYAYASLAASQEIATRRQIATIYTHLARLQQACGQTEDAIASLRHAVDLAAGQQDACGMSAAEWHLAALYLEQQRTKDAAQAAEQAVQHADLANDPNLRADALLTLARVREAQKRYQDAEASYTEALDLLKRMPEGVRTPAAEALSAAYAQYSHFLDRRGDTERAFQMLKEAYTATGRTGA